jgi:hypothetical protein
MHVRPASVVCVALLVSVATLARAQIQPLSVWGTGPGDVWVVGATQGPLHFSGTTWEKLSLGGTDLVALYAVWGSGPNDVFVGGDLAGAGAIYRWDGRTWTKLTVPTRYPVVALQGRSAAEVYALARTGIHGRVPSLLRWDGNAWTDIPLPMAFFATGLAVHGDEVLVAGYVNADEAPGSARTPGVLARLRAGQWSVSGWTGQRVGDSVVASARWVSMATAGDTIYLSGELPDGKTTIVMWSGGAWAPLLTPEADGRRSDVKLAVVTGDHALVALLTGGAGYVWLAGGQWSLVAPPDAYNPPAGMSRDDLLSQTLAWGEVDDARGAWGPAASDFFLVTGGGRIVRFRGGAPAIVFDASCADPAVAARSPVCRSLRRP